MNRYWPAPLKNAIRELAETFARQTVATAIVAADAHDFIDDDVIVAYWSLQRATGSDIDAWMKIFESLAETQAVQLQSAVATAHPAALRILCDATVAHVAEWLAQQATLEQRNLEPSDEESSRSFSFAHEVDDPMIGDRRALARAYR